MIFPTNIEPIGRETVFGKTLNTGRASSTQPIVESPKQRERWLAVVGAEDSEARSLDIVRRFANEDAEIHLARLGSLDPATETRRLAIGLEADWLYMTAQRGTGLMSLFLRENAENILRTSPCPVICIPESLGARWSANEAAIPKRRVLAPIKLSLHSHRQVLNALAVAERFGAKLDLLGVEELLRKPQDLRTANHREAKRLRMRAVKKELVNLAEEIIPKRRRGRILVSVEFPLFYATNLRARELGSDLFVLAAPTRLWAHEGRIDVGTERILQSADCPVIVIPELTELNTSRTAWLKSALHSNSDWSAALRRSSEPALAPFTKRMNVEPTRHRSDF